MNTLNRSVRCRLTVHRVKRPTIIDRAVVVRIATSLRQIRAACSARTSPVDIELRPV